MSYLVTISREGAPLADAEVDAAFRADASFSVEGSPVTAVWQGLPGTPHEHFVYEDGAITVTTPSDAALVKMQQLAAALGAKVRGEEGEDLTDVPVPPPSAGGMGLGALALAAMLAGVLWWVLR